MLDQLQLPSGSIVVLDRCYIDFKRLSGLVQCGCSIVARAKVNMNYSCSDWHAVDIHLGVLQDQTIGLVLP